MHTLKTIRLLAGRSLRALSRPLLSELPLVVTFILLNYPKDWQMLLAGQRGWRGVAPMLVGFVFAYVLALMCMAAGRRWVRAVCYAVGIGLFTTNLFLWFHFKQIIGPDVVQLLAETHGAEAGEFVRAYVLQPHFLLYVAIAVLLGVAVAVAEQRYRRLRADWAQRPKVRLWGGGVALAALLGGISYLDGYTTLFTARDTDDVCQAMGCTGYCHFDPISRTLYTVRVLHLARRELRDAVRCCQRSRHQATLTAQADTLTVVLVVGESYIKRHAALYGYALPTTPCMQRERKAGRLLAFTDVVSPYHITSHAMRHIFCLNSVGAGERWLDHPFFPILFRDAGYEVDYWDGQRDFGTTTPFTFAVNSFFYHRELAPLAYTEMNAHGFRYDGELVDDYCRHHPATAARRLVMVHLLGQHSMASERFPHIPAFERFKPADVPNRQRWMDEGKRQEVADYDNATLYNDSVMSRLFTHFGHANAVLLYLSDHGEEVYDAHDNMGRRCDSADTASLRLQHEVPFVLWMSDVYRQRHPEVVARAQAALHRPYMTDNVGHLLLALAGIRTPYYIKERDLLSPAFCPQPRLLDGTDDYDQLCGAR